ncbi:MAG TPA: DUF1553 domain-containing protein [Tepidisphaeraceae bacterium]|jgi:hypothetical protein|nr:DUF1553 domain-containing protein [Tepidisphaeraceae bacterium]
MLRIAWKFQSAKVSQVAAAIIGLGSLAIVVGKIAPSFVQAADVAPDAAPENLKFFDEQVKPLLEANCLKCHGGGEKIKANFRLTQRDSILKGGDLGLAVATDAPADSLLLKAINYDGDLKMPPSGKLPPEKIAVLTKWVKDGLAWTPGLDLTPANLPAPSTGRPDPPTPEAARKNFWAVQPVKRPPIPAVKNPAWVRNPVDAFILAKLEAAGLKPAPPAGKISLLRRATYDLTGLPPTPAEVDAYVADPSPDAYEKVVDRLLASPQYGEKWGRYWLDLVRYGESNSYERDDTKPNVWRFRDYVIRSFNQDKPYDQFAKEQLAGDEMPDAIAGKNYDPIIATGFYRLGIWDDEPSDRLQARYDNLDDIVTTTGQVFLGLTIDCARCHNHKIDPILQTDYYRLLAFFQNINGYHNGGKGDEVEIFKTEGGREAYEAAAIARKKQADAVQARAREIEEEFRKLYTAAARPQMSVTDIDDLHYRFYRDSWKTLPNFDDLKFEAQGDLPSGLIDIAPRTRNTAFGFVFTGALIVPRDGNYTFYLDSDDGSRLSIDGKTIVEYDGIHGIGFERHAEVSLHKGRLPIRVEYFQNVNGYGLSVAWSGPAMDRRSLSVPNGDFEHHRSVARGPGKNKNLGRAIFDEGADYLDQQTYDEYRKLRRELDELNKQPKFERALCVSEPGPGSPDTFVCIRGNANVPGEKVAPGFPKVFADGDAVIPKPAPGAKTSGRRTVLANWITSEQNPMFARVMANRIFQYHFGRGIVRSPNNFGVQGDHPTHPQLLDWLASEFRANGFKLKPMHRLLMTSNAYRMSCEADPGALAQDPRNDLFWRFDLRRLTAEEVRDSILAVDGTLNLEMFGPSVYPDIPAAVKQSQSIPGRNWLISTPAEAARRSVYVHVKRSLAVPILSAFDAAETDRSCPVRFVTVQPTQALGMLNGAFLNGEAEKLAARLKHEAGDDISRQIALAFRLATCRTPTEKEIARSIDLIQSLQKKNGAAAEQAIKYFCLMVLNLNEFVYLD